jgi:hypothetical protein
MKKPLIVFLIAFAVSLCAGTGLAFIRAPKPPAAPAGEKSAKHASGTTHDTTAHDSATEPDATPTSEETDKGIPHVASAEAETQMGMSSQTEASEATTGRSTHTAHTGEAHYGTAATSVSAPTSDAKHSAPKQLAVDTKAADSALTTRLAHIFAAMQPKDAAHVLEQMDNHDIQVILLELSNKQQASILSNLPVQRAAAIARETLRGSSSTP